MDSAWWTSKTAGKQLIMSPNMVTRIKPNWEQIKICFQVSFVIRHGTCRDCEMLQRGITERHSCFKVLALDRAVRNLCKFLHLPLPSSREWKVDDLVLSRRISRAIWTAQAQWFPMAPAQSGPGPQSQRGSLWSWYPWFVAGYAGRPGSTGNCPHFWGNLALEMECCWCRAFFLGMVEVVRGTCSGDTPSFPQQITRHIKTLFAKRNCFLGRINFPILKRSFYLFKLVGFRSQLL